jgi:hypothetical protein
MRSPGSHRACSRLKHAAPPQARVARAAPSCRDPTSWRSRVRGSGAIGFDSFGGAKHPPRTIFGPHADVGLGGVRDNRALEAI